MHPGKAHCLCRHQALHSWDAGGNGVGERHWVCAGIGGDGGEQRACAVPQTVTALPQVIVLGGTVGLGDSRPSG